MKHLILLFLLLSFPALADTIKLDNVPLSNLVRLYFAEINQDAYHLPDEFINDDRRLSLSISGTPAQLRNNLADILKGYGFELYRADGMYSVRKIAGTSSSDERQVFIYRPRSRTSQYLVDVVRHLYPGITQGAQGLPNTLPVTGEYEKTSATAQIDNKSDRIVFRGSETEIKALSRYLAILDVPAPAVELQIFLIERTKKNENQTGFSLLIDKLGFLSLSVGSLPLSGDVLRISSGSINLAIAALKTDNDFSIYTAPKLMLVDRKKSRLVVGQDVPVLTSTTTNNEGTTQSIEYRSSGVIMEASADILADSIQVDSSIEVSSFARTTTGVSDSPTLTKRTIQSSTILTDGSAVLYGGLTFASKTEGSSGLFFLPKALRNNSDSSEDGELFVLMVARRI